MYYTLRIIDQTPIGAEERRNIIFDKEYNVIIKTPHDSQTTKEGTNHFEKALSEFYGIDYDKVIDQTIIGFVYINDTTYPIRDYNAVYIVGSEGQTVERIYGMYNKF